MNGSKIDSPIAAELNACIDETRSTSFSQTIVKAFDRTSGKPFKKTMTVGFRDLPFELDVTHVGQLNVVGNRLASPRM